MSTKLSIITICYNEPDLKKTCDSIINQTWQDFEWIVIDGGSNQETLDIFQQYRHRINKFVSEKDNGIYNAMNKGIKMATGKYINFLNAGDYYSYDNTLEQVIKHRLNKDIVFGDVIFTSITENKTTSNKLSISPDTVSLRFLYTSALPHQSSFIKTSLFFKYGFYNEDYKIVSDWEKWLVFIILHHCSYKHIPFPISTFNLNGISSTNRKLNAEERTIVLNKYFSPRTLKKLKAENYTFWEKIFSIKNNSAKTHKIITILGIKIKKRRHKISS